MAKQNQTTEEPKVEVTQAPAVEEKATEEVKAAEPVVEETQAPAVEEKATEEVKAAEPAPAPTPTVTTTVSEKVATVETKQAPAPSGFDALIAQIKTNGTSVQKDLVSAIEQYLENMKPGKPVQGDAGARHQYVLWKTISAIAENAPVTEFKKLWSILLGYFKEHEKGAFHDRYVFHFSEFWQYDEVQLAAFQRTLNLLKLTANPGTRAAGLKQVDLNRTLADGYSEEARQRIVGFYR